jgi:hypothetical protein
MLPPEPTRKQANVSPIPKVAVAGSNQYSGWQKMSATFLLIRSLTIMTAGFQCAGCGEWNETDVDSSAGMRQQYVEDCQVCCKPNVLQVAWDMSAGEYTISAELES